MSLQNVRRHWKFLVKAILIFLTVIVVGPVVLLGIASLLFASTAGLGSGSAVVVGLGMALVALGWLFFVLWLGNRGDKSSEERIDG